jgi:carbon-monoxide dehydrogenase large subunit
MSSDFAGRREDRRLLTGTGRFTADWTLPHQAHAVFVRSDHAHARIVSIDGRAALQMTGVLAVLTGADLVAAGYKSAPTTDPGPGLGGFVLRAPERPALALDRVRYVGEPVALVVAETEAIALDARERVMVDYEELPAVMTPAAATASGAVQLHESVPGNLAYEFVYGDRAATEAALARALYKVRVTLDAQRLAANPMEPKSCLACYDAATDSFDVYVPTQGMSDIRTAFAHITGLPSDRFRVHAHDVGGGFGVRNEVYPEYVAVSLAARNLRRPVKWTGTRAETIVSDHQGRGVVLTGTLGLDRDGRFIGMHVEWLVNLGAYCSKSGPFINTMASPRSMATNIYRVPALFAHHRLVLTNTTPGTAYRGAGRPSVAYLWERLVDEAARVTGIDSIELRRRNLIPRDAFPYKTPSGSTYDCADPAGLLEAALDAANWRGFAARRRAARSRGRLRGIGCAMFIEPSGAAGKEEIAIRFGRKGEIMLYTLSGPTGQSHETAHAQIVADLLGVDPQTVILRASDPSGPPLTGLGTFGSRSLLSHGVALHYGAHEVIKKGLELAAQALEAATADIAFDRGWYVVKGTDHRISLTELVHRHAGDGGNPLDTNLTVPVSAAFPSGAHISEIEIDPDTGALEVVRYVAVDDCGRIYNHAIVEGQLHGGLMQGLGQVMGEQCVYDPDSGQLLTGSFMDYYMPRAVDLPLLTLIDRPVPSPTNPLGAKGAGEAGATGAVPCLANAVHDALAAVGVRHIEMPYTPFRIWSAIQDAASARR